MQPLATLRKLLAQGTPEAATVAGDLCQEHPGLLELHARRSRKRTYLVAPDSERQGYEYVPAVAAQRTTGWYRGWPGKWVPVHIPSGRIMAKWAWPTRRELVRQTALVIARWDWGYTFDELVALPDYRERILALLKLGGQSAS